MTKHKAKPPMKKLAETEWDEEFKRPHSRHKDWGGESYNRGVEAGIKYAIQRCDWLNMQVICDGCWLTTLRFKENNPDWMEKVRYIKKHYEGYRERTIEKYKQAGKKAEQERILKFIKMVCNPKCDGQSTEIDRDSADCDLCRVREIEKLIRGGVK